MNSTIVTTTFKHDSAYADYSGQSESTHSFKQYGRFSEEFIREKYEFWYEKYDALASVSSETLGMTYEEQSEAIERASRMVDAWHKRLIEYTIY